MPHQIDIIEDNRIIFIGYSGTVYTGESVLIRNTVSDIMKLNGISRILISMKDVEIKSTASEEFLFISELGKYLPSETKIADIAPPDDPNFDRHRFVETICVNRMFNLRIFPDQKSAVAWLLK